jgi:hypothetical protein
MEIDWQQSIGKQIVIEILGYEKYEGIHDQTIITTIRSLSITDTRYKIVTDPFDLSSEMIINFLRLIEISRNKNDAMAIIGYTYINHGEESSSQVEGKIWLRHL